MGAVGLEEASRRFESAVLDLEKPIPRSVAANLYGVIYAYNIPAACSPLVDILLQLLAPNGKALVCCRTYHELMRFRADMSKRYSIRAIFDPEVVALDVLRQKPLVTLSPE